MELPNIYESKHYKKMIAIPLALIIISLFYIPHIPKGVDLKGGSLFTILTEEPAASLAEKRPLLQSALEKYSSDVSVRTFENPSGRGLEIELGSSDLLDGVEQGIGDLKQKDSELALETATLQFMEANEPDKAKVDAQRKRVSDLEKGLVDGINSLLLSINSNKTVTDSSNAVQVLEAEYQDTLSSNRERIISEIRALVAIKSYSAKEVGSSLSRFFLSKTAEILLVSLIAAGLFVVLIFRGAVASLAVLFGAVADLIITAGAMGFFGIPLSLSTVAALLMLIGFSIDTDMLLTIRALKRTEGTIRERIYDAMRTAIVMNSCAIAAFAVLLVTALFLNIETYYQIGAVILIGALIDFIATWCGNAVTVLWYSEIRQAR